MSPVTSITHPPITTTTTTTTSTTPSLLACRCVGVRTLKDVSVVVVAVLVVMMVLMSAVADARRQSGEAKKEGKSAKDCERGTHNCHKQYADCITSRRSYKCKCKDGFYGDGKVCVDDDECEFENGGCVHRCQNTPGNFSCSCYPGFSLAADGLDCVDVNECERNNGGCSELCVNMVGSFHCRCRGNHALHPDGRSCGGSQSSNGWCRNAMGCLHHCDKASAKPCGCRPGYKLAEDGKACHQMCSFGNGGCHHKCTDSQAGPVCSCAPKYILAADQKSCIR
ncbi:hypothetical protein ACOMHN_029109 [Nucella lapillus]